MAITAIDKCDKSLIRSPGLSVHTSCGNQSKLMKIDFLPEDLIAAKLTKFKKNKDKNSPYIIGDKLQMLSRITERKIIHKRGGDFKSSFPLANNIYKASSDEFRALKRSSNKKNKKSVLTLPNEPAPMPQTCTVSDVNEADYMERPNDDRNNVPKKPIASHKRYKKSYQYDYYDRDASHIDLDCSSTDMLKRYDGDGRKVSGKDRKSGNKEEFQGNDVWSVLRNINRFQFRPSPRISEESESIKVKRNKGKKRLNCKDRRLISETRRTEEIAYIADFEVSSKSPSSPSSVDRVTVIVNSDSKRQLQNNNNNNNKLSNLLYRSLTTRQKINNRTNNYLQNKNNLFGGNKEKVMNSLKYDDKSDNSHNLNAFRNSEISVRTSIDSSNHRSLLNQNLNADRSPKTADVNEMPARVTPRSSGQSRGRDYWKYDNAQNNVTSGIQKSSQNATNYPPRSNRKPRLVTTMPSQNQMQKITSAEIKRRLGAMKFPIVILGKDQYCSSWEGVEDYPCQFEGLQKHIWPFMLEWKKDYKPKKGVTKKIEDKTVKKNETNTSKLKNKRSVKEIFVNKKKMDTKVSQPNSPKEEPSALSKKMLNIIFKKSNYDIINEDNNKQTFEKNTRIGSSNAKNISINRVDASTETDRDRSRGLYRFDKRSKTTKSPRGANKGTWLSEYVENVISKIKNGSYYSLEKSGDKPQAQMEIAVQTPKLTGKREHLNPKTLVRDILIEGDMSDDVTVPPIPGFEDPVPAVEVNSLNFNQISIKHCMKNVVLQFDLGVPEKVNAPNNIVDSLVPFEVVANGQTKVFKFKTTILNAVLPAEICGVLPNLMRNFIESNAYMNALYTMKPIEKKPILPAIPQPPLIEPVSNCRPEILPLRISPALRRAGSGMFTEIRRVKVSKALLVNRVINSVSEILTYGLLRDPHVMPLFSCVCDPIDFMLPKAGVAPQKKPVCMAILPHYTATHGQIIPAYKRLNFFDIFKNMITCCSVLFKNTKMMTPLNKELYFTCGIKESVVSVVESGTEIHKRTMTVTINKVKIDSLFNGFLKRSASDGDKLTQSESTSKIFNVGERYSKRNLRIQTNNKTRRVGFVKLYKRCKSTSNISGEKNCTPLSKIMNLDDFFQAFGVSKLLSSVFDGNAERKLMSSIVEMKTWISDITPRQALLMLLLTNRKDTPNLKRFRPILLQGIAVNRITRASELDMEIEVIETENFNKLSQTNAIPYLPAAVVNHDNLYEEMCWIAKTTASDYQKPFDESSEKLLKSLLEKRKKLNPSYLRVMARYVGLGLLKPAFDKK